MTKKILTFSILMTFVLVAWALAAGNPSATGHGEALVGPPTAPISFQYSFVAQVLKNGTKGQAEIAFGPTGERFHVDVDCLNFLGTNTAFIGGIITNVQVAGTPPFPPEGVRIVFGVRDNGEGENALLPDLVGTPAFFPGGGPVVCPVVGSPFVNTEGNIQVRP